jgi:hypothetical protein
MVVCLVGWHARLLREITIALNPKRELRPPRIIGKPKPAGPAINSLVFPAFSGSE